MKKSILATCLLFLLYFEVSAQTEFVLEPSQSMIMTGKGTGQDATINPFYGEDSYGIVKNIGERPFSIRIQTSGNILEEIPIQKGETKKVKLLKGYELYLDPNPDGLAKARADYGKIIDQETFRQTLSIIPSMQRLITIR
ncbi:hypothetical protein [Maribacter aurantiacus]|uniref:DUF4369 domain-containing protein n=1 Tax=Maribacter aurantiacus TaxID=1882343 RepID=A0A5R8M355_9FLAO|nr:hypothetical protein [Maribacter aurantiacus]TLF43995.1 hypothetical protein FEK29_13030 [Maribacter aurantiacus]